MKNILLDEIKKKDFERIINEIDNDEYELFLRDNYKLQNNIYLLLDRADKNKLNIIIINKYLNNFFTDEIENENDIINNNNNKYEYLSIYIVLIKIISIIIIVVLTLIGAIIGYILFYNLHEELTEGIGGAILGAVVGLIMGLINTFMSLVLADYLAAHRDIAINTSILVNK